MIGGAKGIGLGIDLGLVNQYNRTGSQSYIEPEVLDSLVGVWSAYGMTNDSPNRSTIKNKLSNKGGDFVISNAAYDKMSSYGGYEFAKFDNTLDWYLTPDNGYIDVVSRNGYSITLRNLSTSNYGWYFQNSTVKEFITKDIPFKVKANKSIRVYWDMHSYKSNGENFGYVVNNITLNPNEDTSINLRHLTEEELTELEANKDRMYYLLWFDLSTLAVDEEVTIEMLPLFEGAFVTDGIDDLITSTKTVQEMLGGSNEITVVSMIHQVKDSSNNVSFTNYIRGSANGYFRNIVNNYDKTGIYGYTSSDLMGLSVVNNILGDKNDYTSNGDNRDSIINGNFSVQGYSYNDGNNTGDFSSVAWYWTIIANKVLTTDQINQVIAYFNLDRTLKPDILCNIGKQGITNDNHADFNDKLVDYSGNGRDVQMNNLAWKGGSGIAAKPFETIKDYTIVSDEARQKLTIYNEFSYKIKSNTPSYYWTVQSIIRDNTSYQVTIITDKDCYWINATSFINSEGNKESIRKKYPVLANTPTQVIICGLDQFEYPEGIEPTNAVSYVNLEYAGEITITFIPSHKGGLLLDGVNDFGKVTGMPVYKDYTFIIDYERISYTSERWGGAIVSKSPSANNGAFISMMANSAGLNKQLFSFGGVTAFIKDDLSRILFWQTKYKSENTELTVGEGVDGDTLWLGTLRDNDSRFFNGVIYSLMSFPYSMSEFLIERQLKKHKLGTLYPNMVEFRPIVKSNLPYSSISYSVNPGEYISVDSMVTITVTLPNTSDELMEVSCNAISDISISGDNGVYEITGKIVKSPQKINLVISSYLTMLNNETLISNETLIKNE